MSSWSPQDLESLRTADDLHVAPLRPDASTYGTPTWIWSVVTDGQLYARAYNGRDSRWYQAAAEQGAGRITIAGTEHGTTFEALDRDPSDQVRQGVDAAYRSKYAGSQFLEAMVSDNAAAATVRLTPRQS